MTTTLTPSTQQQASESANRGKLNAALEHIFAELHGQFGAQFTDKFRTGEIVGGKDTGIENAKATWAQKILDARLTPAEIRRGLANCGKAASRGFPPNWPEFEALCRPPINVDAALQEAVQQLHARNQAKDVWSHPAIFWAAQQVGYYEMTTLSMSLLKPRFEAALDDVQRQADIKPVPPAMRQAQRLEHTPAPTVSSDEIAQAKAQFNAMLQGRASIFTTPADGMRWARRQLAKRDAGERISLLQEQFAEQALSLGPEPA